MDHLLLFCPIANSLWTYMFRLFGIDWVMPGSVADLLSCWYHWLGKHSSDIWNLVPSYLMWTIWTERNRRSFEDKEIGRASCRERVSAGKTLITEPQFSPHPQKTTDSVQSK